MRIRGEATGNEVRLTVEGTVSVLSVDGKTLVGKDPRSGSVLVVARVAGEPWEGDAPRPDLAGLVGDELDPVEVRRRLRGAEEVWVRFER